MTSSSYLSSALPTVINTRPTERAEPLTNHLQAAGFPVVEIPMLSLQLLPTTTSDVDIMRQWLAGDYQALVIVSPTAAASGLAVWQKLEKERRNDSQITTAHNENKSAAVKTMEPNSHVNEQAPSHIIAVGAATAAVLQDPNLQLDCQVLKPVLANNEGMLAMPEIESLQAGDKLLVWRGLGGRRLLVDTLQARGVHIDSIAWYERTMPDTAHTEYQQWLSGFIQQKISTDLIKPVVIISSGTAFEHWLSVVENAQKRGSNPSVSITNDRSHKNSVQLADFSYVVLGERLANIVAERQLSHCQVEDLDPETILTAIKSNFINR
ncbi:uroporphyrinogen-III synthase [Psychrobacter jeotgali]|uniref:uroporphyrinogen-III synthase n=1 Tax=Psychrobacter jeotgali TaxID=179010 RepID=UPI0019189460|nr:uroporphyrinogen-III synthase [Psychrobacter jeotgali]